MSLCISLIDSNFRAETFSANTGDQGVSEFSRFLLLLGVLDCDAAEAVCRLVSSMCLFVSVSY